jgi:putative ABC transport system permease protein
MSRLRVDVGRALRVLTGAPGFAAASLLALALGIGATTAIFSFVDAVLLKPLPFRDPGRLLVVYERNPAGKKDKVFVAPANFGVWRERSRSLEAMAAISDTHINLTGGANGRVEPEELKAERVSAGLFDLLGVEAVVGRVFRPAEDQPGHANVALLGYSLWQRRFGADPAISGKSVRLRDQSYVVVGVLPPAFALKEPGVEIFLPLVLNPNDRRTGGVRNLVVVGRLRRGISLAAARAELDAIGRGLELSNPALDRGWGPSLFSLQDELVGDVRQSLLVLLGAVGLLLGIACANVANLLLARASSRRKEIAIRTALGATRLGIALDLLGESVVLGVAGGVLGTLLARLAISLLKYFGPAAIPRLEFVAMDWRVLLFALAISLASGVLFGLAPALAASRADLSAAMAEGARGATPARTGRWMRDALVVVEVALALVVLIGAGLLLRSFVRLRATHLGFGPEGVLTYRMPMAGGRNSTPARATAFLDQALAHIGGLPGVRAAAAVNALPLTGLGTGVIFTIDGRPAPSPGERPIALIRFVTRDYFHAMTIPLEAGREFDDSDTAESPLVAIVNRTLARRFRFTASSLGERLAMETVPPRTARTVGVVGDVKPERVEGDDWPTIYIPFAQMPAPAMVLVVRTEGPPEGLAAAIERRVHDLDPDQPLAERRTMAQIVDRAVSGARFDTVLLTGFGLVAFSLAAVGIYGVISFDVGRRTRELAIRSALGARPGDLLRLVVGEGARLAGIGILLGIVASYLLASLLASMLYTVQPRDLTTFAAVPVALAVVALAACYIPARRAVALAPSAALRHE